MTHEVETITVDTFHKRCKAQGVSGHAHVAFKCPICGTVQSGADFMRELNKSFDEIEKYIAFSCIGRMNGAGEYRKDDEHQIGCNWSLGGLLQLHKMQVINGEGNLCPRFEFATPAEAVAHEKGEPKQ